MADTWRKGYGSRGQVAPDFSRCCEEISDRLGWSWYQCTRKAAYDPDELGRMTHCKIHSKAKAKEKQEAYEARFKAERDAASARRRRQEMRDEAITLLRQIADGHNDPRTAARDFIAEYDKGESA